MRGGLTLGFAMHLVIVISGKPLAGFCWLRGREGENAEWFSGKVKGRRRRKEQRKEEKRE